MESAISLVSSKPYPYPLILLGGTIYLKWLRSYNNVWGMLARKFYAGSRQFSGLTELADAVLGAWNGIGIPTVHRLYESIPKHLLSLVDNKGGPTKCCLQ